jgi:hypothetical protein
LVPSPAERRRQAEGGRSFATFSALAANHRQRVTGQNLMGTGDAEHIALARPAQRYLDLANTVDRVRRHPGEGNARRDGALNYAR